MFVRLVLFLIVLFSSNVFAEWTTPEPLRSEPIPLETVPSIDPSGKPLTGLIITIDAGHGGSSFDRGYAGSARGVNSRVVEGDLNILAAGRLRHLLRGAGAEVHMTRLDDRRVTLNPEDPSLESTNRAEELGARVDKAVETASHLFLSLHHNAVGRATADGVVVLIWPTDSKGADQPLETAFADALREEVEKTVHHSGEFGHYVHNHPLTAHSDIPSAVVEFGFLTNPEFDAWVTRPGAQNEEAVGVYNAVKRFWAERGEELEAKRRELFPAATPIDLAALRAKVETESNDRPAAQSATETFVGLGDDAPKARRYARTLLPKSAVLPLDNPADVQRCLNLYKGLQLSDKTSFRFDVRVKKTGDAWSLEGAVNHPKIKKAAVAMAAELVGGDVEDNLRLLPDEAVGAKKFGVIRFPMALTWGNTEEAGAVQTQALLGEPIYLLDIDPERTHYLIHAADSYIGWVRRDAVRPMEQAEFTKWNARPMARIVKDYLVDDFRIPAGGLLPVVKYNEEVAVLQLPMKVRASSDDALVEVPLENLRLPQTERPGDVAAQAAIEYLYTPYVFGARSRLGIDCSGLTGVAWSAAGVTLPRDAHQQIRTGRLVGTPGYLDGLQPGDTLYFIDETGRVSHTGVSIGGKRFIHASPPEVNVNSLDPADPLYSEAWRNGFSFGRRPAE